MRLIISPDILKQSTEPVEKVKEVLKVWNVERRVAQVGKTKVRALSISCTLIWPIDTQLHLLLQCMDAGICANGTISF